MKVALIGLGNMGKNHLRVLNESDYFSLEAIVEPQRPETLPKLDHPVSWLNNVDEINFARIDAAVVATPTQTHYQLVKYLMERGLHVLVEKPAASTYEQAVELNQIAKRCGVHLAVGNIERCNPVIFKLKEVLSSGLIGVPVHLNAVRGGGFPSAVKPGNNVILDLAVHDLDAFRLLLGSLRVTASVSHATVLPGISDTAEITVESNSGITGSVHVNWLSPQKIREIRVTGTKGVCVVDYIGQTCEVYGKDLDLAHVEGARSLEHPFCSHWQLDIEKGEPLKIQLGEWHRCLTGKPHGLAVYDQLTESVHLAEQAMELSRGGLEPIFFSNNTWLSEAEAHGTVGN